MAVYNAESFLLEAIESILGQSFDDLEVVIVDDGSTDASAAILSRVRDRRLRVLTNPRNLGIATALNRGVDASRGVYIARFDADDVCARDRLRRQVTYLDRNEAIAILGSAARVVGDGAADGTIWRAPTGPLAVRFASLLRSPFLHPTVMLRRAAFEQGELAYDACLVPAEDYALWSRVLRSVDGANLPEPLITYRLHGSQMTSTRRSEMLGVHDRIAATVIARELPYHQVTPEQITNMRRAFVGGEDSPCDRLSAVQSYLALTKAFGIAHGHDPEIRQVRQGAVARAAGVLSSATRDGAFFATLRDMVRIEPTFPFAVMKQRLRRTRGQSPGSDDER